MTTVSLTSSFPKTVQPGIPKHSELPTGWTRTSIGDFLHEVRRPIKMADDEEYRLVTVKRARGGVVERSRLRGREVSVKSQFLLETGDFLISKRQIVHGACGIVPAHLEGAIVSNEYSVLNGCPDIDMRFMNYLAHSIFFQQTCFHSSIGVHIEKMIFKLDRWLQFKFDLPPLPEQGKIADILSTWDQAIEKTEALLTNARTQKRALMQQLLTGKRRFPAFEGQPWKEVQLGSFGKCIRGVSYKPDQLQSFETAETMRLYRSMNIQNGEITEEPFVIVPKSLVTNERVLIYGDLAVCMSNGSKPLVGKSAPIRTTDESHTVGAFCAIFRTQDVELQDFVRVLFQSPMFDQHITVALAGSSINNLKNSDVEGMRFAIPTCREEMITIANVMTEVDTEIVTVAEQVTKLRTEKKALMQQLLTGKRRVKVEDHHAV